MIKKKQVFGQYVYNKDLYLISLFFLVKITFQKFYLTTTKKEKKVLRVVFYWKLLELLAFFVNVTLQDATP